MTSTIEPSAAATAMSAEVTASRSPKSSSFRPGGDAGLRAEHDPEPEQARDHDGHRGVAPDLRRSPEHDDGDGRHEHPHRAAENERHPEQRGHHEPREERVGERLGAVGELVADDPAAEHAADDPDERELEEGPLHEPERPRFDERVHHSSWW